MLKMRPLERAWLLIRFQPGSISSHNTGYFRISILSFLPELKGTIAYVLIPVPYSLLSML